MCWSGTISLFLPLCCVLCRVQQGGMRRFPLLEDEQARELALMPLIEEAFAGEVVVLPLYK